MGRCFECFHLLFIAVSHGLRRDKGVVRRDEPIASVSNKFSLRHDEPVALAYLIFLIRHDKHDLCLEEGMVCSDPRARPDPIGESESKP